jgi:RND family efflux transporter MFP subunit
MIRFLIRKNANENLPHKHKRIYFGIIVIVAVLASVFGLKHKTVAATPVSASALTVTSVAAANEKWPKTLEASGPVTAWQEAIIGSEISGQRLISVFVDVGDTVKKGQVLAKYNTDMLLAEKAELQANWVQADADRKRAFLLKDKGVMSTQMIESYINRASVAKARLDAKNLELRYALVTAPDDGVISSRTATLGTIGNPGTELFRMILRNKYEWRGELTAQQLVNVKIGQIVKLTLPDGNVVNATIRQISPAFNAESRMATVYADIEPNSRAHAGMYANGKIEMELSNVVSVPAESVVIRDGYSYVYKLANNQNQSKVVQQRVTAGRHLGNQVEIMAGLHTGEHVVAKGAGFLNDGDTVRLAPQTDIPS